MKNKILIFGTYEYGLIDMIEISLSNLCEVTSVAHAEKFPYNFLTKLPVGFLGFIGVDIFFKMYKARVNKELVSTINLFRPNILLVLKGNMLDQASLANLNVYKIMLLWDSLNNISIDPQVFRDFDSIYTFNKDDVIKIREINQKVEFLKLGYSNSYYYYKDNKSIDILISGAINDHRFNLAIEILEEFNSFEVLIVGPVPSFLKQMYIHYFILINRITSKFLIKNLSHIKLNELYNKSKIVVNIPQEHNLKSMNMRFYECIATKTMQIVYRTDESEQVLTDKFLFSSTEDLLYKLNCALNNYDSFYKEYQDLIERRYHYNSLDYRLKKMFGEAGIKI